jgi:hypothetical protein
MQSFVIGISGRKGSGKSFAANEIKCHLKRNGIDVIEIAVSKPLKPIAASLFYPCTVFDDLYSNEAKEQLVYEMPSGDLMVESVTDLLNRFNVVPQVYKFETNQALARFMCEEFCTEFGGPFSMENSNFLKTPRTFGWVLQYFGTETVRYKVSNTFWTNLTAAVIEKTPGTYIIPDVRYQEEEAIVRRFNGTIIRVENDVHVDTGSDGRSTEHPSETSFLNIIPDVVIKNDMTEDFKKKLLSYIDSIY